MRLLTALLACVVLALAGCADPSGSGAAAGSSRSGTLTGRVGITGGAARPDGKSALSNSPAQDEKVIVTAADQHVYTALTGRDGRFSIALVAGRYSVRADCSPSMPVVVAAGRTSTQDLQCDVP